MKKLFALAMVLLFATGARAQFLGQLTDARVQDQGRSFLGGYIGIYDDDAFAAFGQYRYGFARDIDGGFKLGFVDAGRDDGFGAAGDARYQILHQKPASPQQAGDAVDLSLGGGLEFFFGSDFTVVSFQFNGMVSHRFISASGRGMTPYGRMQVRLERSSMDLPPPQGDQSDTEGEFGINAGGEFEFARQLSAVGELQLDSSVDFGLIFGLNYRF